MKSSDWRDVADFTGGVIQYGGIGAAVLVGMVGSALAGIELMLAVFGESAAAVLIGAFGPWCLALVAFHSYAKHRAFTPKGGQQE